MITITIGFVACNGHNDVEVADVKKKFVAAHYAVQQVHVQY
jgi:hypothetical protein